LRLIFQSLLPLCIKRNEYGGYINPETGEIDGPFEGNENSIEIGEPEEMRAKAEKGWRLFHTHPGKSYQFATSTNDTCATYISGCVSYVIFASGVCEIRPKKYASLSAVSLVIISAKNRAKDLATKESDDSEANIKWHFEDLISKLLPVQVNILYKVRNGILVETA